VNDTEIEVRHFVISSLLTTMYELSEIRYDILLS